MTGPTIYARFHHKLSFSFGLLPLSPNNRGLGRRQKILVHYTSPGIDRVVPTKHEFSPLHLSQPPFLDNLLPFPAPARLTSSSMTRVTSKALDCFVHLRTLRSCKSHRWLLGRLLRPVFTHFGNFSTFVPKLFETPHYCEIPIGRKYRS